MDRSLTTWGLGPYRKVPVMFRNNQRLIAAFTKAGFHVEPIIGTQSWESMRANGVKDESDLTDDDRTSTTYRVISGKRIVTWHTQGTDALCVHCTNVNDGRDSMTDYFPGSFALTIKGAVSYLQN